MSLSLEFLIMGTVGALVWLIRLEGKVRQNERLFEETQKDVDLVRNRLEIIDSKLAVELSKVRESLARIEGHMGLRGE